MFWQVTLYREGGVFLGNTTLHWHFGQLAFFKIFSDYSQVRTSKNIFTAYCWFAMLSCMSLLLFGNWLWGELFHCDTCSAMLLMSLQFSSDFTQHHFNYVPSQSQPVMRKRAVCHRLLAKRCEAGKTVTWPGYSFRYRWCLLCPSVSLEPSHYGADDLPSAFFCEEEERKKKKPFNYTSLLLMELNEPWIWLLLTHLVSNLTVTFGWSRPVR